jgi:hypothetical protein
MKKHFLFLLALISFGFMVNAQDVILKQDGTEIKAKVLEIIDQYVKYKDFDFQDGPIRNIKRSDIFMITYENGQREVFKQETLVPDPPPPTPSTPTPQEKLNNMPFSDLKNEFYRIGTDDKAMLDFFKRNNFTKYYQDFESACITRKDGTTALGVGIGITGFGVIFLGVGLGISNSDFLWAGGVFIATGQIMTIIGIPVSARAGTRKNTIKNNFAREYFGIGGYTYQPTLNLNYTGNGVGVSLKF